MTATLAPTRQPVLPEFFEPDDPPITPRPVPDGLRPWKDPHPGVGWFIALIIGAVAFGTRFWALASQGGYIFDEVYYAKEGQELLRFGYEDNRGYLFIVHPPLGKWMIALGSDIFGDKAFGWRVMGALAGTLTVILVTRIARRMFRSNLFGAVAGVLMAMDGLSLVLARTALLDIYLQLFVVAAFGALIVDRDRVRARLADLISRGVVLTDTAPSLGPRPWRLLAGALFGCAVAVKWTALSYFLFFVILSFLWDRGALRTAGVRRPTRAMFRRSVTPGLTSLLATPIAVYLLTYLGWFTGENGYNRHWADTHSAHATLNIVGIHIPMWWGWLPGPIRSLGASTYNAYQFHEGLDSYHPYQSSPWSWLVDGRPVDFFYEGKANTCGAQSCAQEILALGTPLLWWAFVPMLLWLAWHWFTTRDWRAGAIWIAFFAGWLVWFHDLKRTMFFFYMAPLVPFLVLGVTLALGVVLGPGLRQTGDVVRDNRAVLRRNWGLVAVTAYVGIVVWNFVWFWPIFTAWNIPYAEWHSRMWLPSWV